MLAAGVVLLIVIVAASIWFVRGLERFATEEADREDALRDPDVPVAEYSVPNGVDPAGIGGRLAIAGFHAARYERAGASGLRVACAPDERDRVRKVIARAVDLAVDGESSGRTVVVFEDERSPLPERGSASA